MKAKKFATYPIAYFNSFSEKAFMEREKVFDDKSRDSYFRSLEVAQKNLALAFKK